MKDSRFFASALTLLCLNSALEAGHHKEIVVIGDSGSDSGNTPFGFYQPLINAPKGIVWPQYPAWSNGAKWVVQLGDMWGIEVRPSRQGGLNFACAGAQTGVDSSFFELADVRTPGGGADIALNSVHPISTFYVPSMVSQTNEFLTQKQYVSKKAVIFHRGVLINLIVDFLAPPVDPVGDAIRGVNDTVANLTALKNAGYRNQVVFNYANPPIVLTPPVFPLIPLASQELFVSAFNTNLLSTLKQASLHPVVIDLQSFEDDLVNNLAFYGFTGGLGPMNTVTGPNNTLFWFDGLHFSEQHEFLLSQYVFNILEAPECWGRFAEQPFALMRGLNAVLRQELYPISDLCDCRLYTFLSGNYAPQQEAPFINGKARDTSGWNGTLGFAYKFCSYWTLGLAGSYNQNNFENRFATGRSEVDLRSWMVSLFSGMEFCHGYFNGIFNVGFMKFDDISRRFTIGPQKWKARGDTDGMQYDILFEGGWYFWDCCNFKFGPIATIEYQRADVDGYREHGASYNNLQYKHQHANSFVTGIGLEGLMWFPCGGNCCEEPSCDCEEDCPPGYSITAFLSVNEDWIHNTRRVHFRQISLGDAPFGQWPIYQKRTFFGSGGINLTKTFNNGAIFSVGYRGDWGQHHMGEHNIIANLTFPLWYFD